MLNTSFNLKVAHIPVHELAKPVADKVPDAASEATAFLHHFLSAAYERIQERLDFSADFLESGKFKSIMLQKYRRENDHPYSSILFHENKKKLRELRSNASGLKDNKTKAEYTNYNGGKGNATPDD